MKQTIGIITAILVAITPASFAATVSSPLYVTSADVAGGLNLTVNLIDGCTSSRVTSIEFNTLTDIGTGTLRSECDVNAMITVNSHGDPYTVTQDGTAMSNGAVILPTGASIVTPAYSALDNGGQGLPAGASLGSGGTFAITGKTLYTSDTAGSLRTFQAHYAITDDPAAGATSFVPLDQPQGSYSGTVIITVTTTEGGGGGPDPICRTPPCAE